MPFTFSHPAIILPLSKSKKIHLSFTGLIVGSMVPDFEFLLRLRNTENFGHMLPGIFIFDIPFAVILSFVFHYLVRNTLILHAPKYFRQRFSELLSFNWTDYFERHTINFLIAVLIGVGSHFFLDSFTHENTTLENWMPVLSKEVVIGKQSVPVYMILQGLTSLLGALYMLWFIDKMKKGEDLQNAGNGTSYWISIGAATILIFAVRLIVDTIHQSIADIIIAGVGSFVYAVLFISLLYLRRTITAIKKSPGI